MEQSIEARSGELLVVPLSLLVPSPHNVRKTNGTDVSDLIASIKAQGLLQNLIVCPAQNKRGKPSGKYEVVGGKRRLTALNALAHEGEIAPDEGIVCRVKPTREAAEASLAENHHREAMHPADELEAFQRLVQEGRSIEDVALRFGTSPLTVRRRLKLAGLHPNLIQLYREEGITLEQLMALAVSDDQDEQLRVWESMPIWRRHPSSLRDALVADEIDASSSPLAQLVGIEVYEAAGGRVRRDLFSEDGTGYLLDAGLLERLASERLEAAAESVRAEGWSWVDVVPSASAGELFAFGRCPKTHREMTKAETKKHRSLVKSVERLAAETMADEDDDDAAAARESRLDEAQQQLRDFEEGLATYGDEAYAQAGAVLCVGRGGGIEVHRGLIRPSDRKAISARRHQGDGEDDASPDQASARPLHSAALMLDLTAQRTLAARAALLDRPDIALCALLDCLAQRLLCDNVYVPASAVRLMPNAPDAGLVPKPGNTLGESRAAQAIEEARQHWGDRLPGESERLLPWLIGLSDSDRRDLLALCVALTLNDVRDGERSSSLDPLSVAIELDMADWWTATAENYFCRVTKDTILAALAEGAGPEAAARVRGVSKGELARVAERDLKETRWLPTPLRKITAPTGEQ